MLNITSINYQVSPLFRWFVANYLLGGKRIHVFKCDIYVNRLKSCTAALTRRVGATPVYASARVRIDNNLVAAEYGLVHTFFQGCVLLGKIIFELVIRSTVIINSRVIWGTYPPHTKNNSGDIER